MEFSIVMVTATEFKDGLKSEVGLFDLVIEGDIVLREFEALEFAFFGDDFAEDIETSEDPATTGKVFKSMEKAGATLPKAPGS